MDGQQETDSTEKSSDLLSKFSSESLGDYIVPEAMDSNSMAGNLGLDKIAIPDFRVIYDESRSFSPFRGDPIWK